MQTFFYLFLSLIYQSNKISQDTCKVFGNWRIEKIIFVSPPKKNEFDEIWKSCYNEEIVITKSKFIFNSNECFLYKSIDNFKISEHYILTLQQALNSSKYYDKTIFYLFNDGKRKTLEAYKTNYNYESSEGEVPELEIFIIDYKHIIINQDNNIVFLRRK